MPKVAGIFISFFSLVIDQTIIHQKTNKLCFKQWHANMVSSEMCLPFGQFSKMLYEFESFKLGNQTRLEFLLSKEAELLTG